MAHLAPCSTLTVQTPQYRPNIEQLTTAQAVASPGSVARIGKAGN